MASPVYVTQPFLPPLEELQPLLEEIWRSRRLTNGGPFHERLERALCDYLGVKHISLFANGTLGLVTALQSLRITGEVITTPFSFVATAHALLWNGIRPVFVDIHPESLNLDPEQVEAAITPLTTAILPVHVYGRPCDTSALQSIADRYGLRLIYDAAHAFAVEDEGGSVLRHGDLSVLSFHATKVFTTFEGGAIVSRDPQAKRRIDFLKNFGFTDEVTVVAPGINGKLNELQAAVGLVQLGHVDTALERRAAVDEAYRCGLEDVGGIRCLGRPKSRRHNYSYFPILVDAEFPIGRDALYEHLRSSGIFARRYFYPLITDFPMYRSLPSADKARLPVAAQVASQVLCLPIYPDMSEEETSRIVAVISAVAVR
ncbi:MAG: DegT/DnrJ/EryC1/StrS family aminotransferase [Betaproteobacteria bacterium]|jgi:dTDP-4-amino-4,6-dideoxygalactose transaminase|nr:DegT/DnrJ/EryC1/StrS family aminotransferase [Rhodocyclaceae bacterium]MCA3133209.1 DegT/DnrJ/EryC1/StrS family aminotransferase [Rhodocyclaceae bacterium]MCA3140620.1 DegT/DnrJ/EryC1/StrS family aminotransferase [Rhodocyclaceae bacterium]MCA3144207.1 DegT/DnrJ/EryC1/StrS family aminotransferase [Rhodocyclaceae bacterium]MCE2897876.1 DegT/DnrJ/EryC1/StrS family aminotransferase [Betaproteobacteria bacterium]